MRADKEDKLNPEYLQQYAIADREGDFEKALQNGGKVSASGLISVKSDRARSDKPGNHKEMGKAKRKGNDSNRGRSKKKKF